MPVTVSGISFVFTDGLVGLPHSFDLDDEMSFEALRRALRVVKSYHKLMVLDEYRVSTETRNHSSATLQDILELAEEVEGQSDWIVPDYVQLFITEARLEYEYRQQYGKSRPAPQSVTSKDRGGFVYLLKSDTGYYKIGHTVNPDNRITTFGVLLPFEVEYDHLIQSPDMRRLESDLHRRYEDKRVNGEWFDLSVDDVAYIKSLGGES